jgi:hypothetical protein
LDRTSIADSITDVNSGIFALCSVRASTRLRELRINPDMLVVFVSLEKSLAGTISDPFAKELESTDTPLL